MNTATLYMNEGQHALIVAHLLPNDSTCEEAGFGFCNVERDNGGAHFELIEWMAVPPNGFSVRSSYYLELSDETRASVIKRAHDLHLSLVEFHSHPSPLPAAFSPSDIAGFREFVPHVWWRLKGQPYAAVVVAPSGFDALAWLDDPEFPEPVCGIQSGGRRLVPTGHSYEGIRNGQRSSF